MEPPPHLLQQMLLHVEFTLMMFHLWLITMHRKITKIIYTALGVQLAQVQQVLL
jgi:hypothetical protein